MPNPPRLTGNQLLILNHAAERPDGAVLQLPEEVDLKGRVRTIVLKSLLDRNLIEPIPGGLEADVRPPVPQIPDHARGPARAPRDQARIVFACCTFCWTCPAKEACMDGDRAGPRPPPRPGSPAGPWEVEALRSRRASARGGHHAPIDRYPARPSVRRRQA